MIRQLHRLQRHVPAFGPNALALAVYAEPDGDGFVLRSAAEQGYEGVACVDDAARAAVLYSEIWRRHAFPWARERAEGLLAFVCAMQNEDGAFVNFIADWSGRRQLQTPTSWPGGVSWQARALHALASGVSAFGDDGYAGAFERGLRAFDAATPQLDVLALATLATHEYWRASGERHAATRSLGWAEAIAAARIGDVLPDREGDTGVHLWGHLQEAAVARVGAAFGRDDLVEIAANSADAILAPAVRAAFPGTGTLPFDVSSTVCDLDGVAAATGRERYAHLASLARAWFDGRNAARTPIYDRERGLVRDGIDGDRASNNSGAESNIEGALALLDTLPREAYSFGSPGAIN
ncbi:MAG: hypothetical protein WC273_11585 [Dehalococcoidia bacterium]